MRAILLLLFLTALPATTHATPPSTEDEALLEQCIQGYLANLESFNDVEFRQKLGFAERTNYEAVYRGDFLKVKWFDESKEFFHPGMKRHDTYVRDEQILERPSVRMTTAHGELYWIEGHCYFKSNADFDDREFEYLFNNHVKKYLTGKYGWERVQGTRNPTFTFKDCVIIEFDPTRGYLPVYFRVGACENSEPYANEYRILDAKRIFENRWFPLKYVATPSPPSSIYVCEILALETDKPLLKSESVITLPPQEGLHINEERPIFLNYPLMTSLEDFPRLPQLALKYKFNQLLSSEPLALPQFFYNKPQALWFLAPYLLILALPILALIAFRLYRRNSSDKA